MFDRNCIVLDLSGLRRNMSFPANVKAIGYIKENWHNDLRYNRDSLIFGITLSSTGGTVHRQVNEADYHARCPVYGFSHPGDRLQNISSNPWEELYITYSAKAADDLEKLGVDIQVRQEFTMTHRIMNALQIMLRLLENPHGSGNVDRIDLTAYQLIMECQLAAMKPESDDPVERIVRDAASWIQLNYLERLDINTFLQGRGMSYWTFLRKWKTMFSKPPVQYALELKIAEGCRLLKETELTVEAIAYQLKIDDPLYFSRLFRQHKGISPRQYRQQFM